MPGEDSEYVRVANLRDNGDGRVCADVQIAVGGFRGGYSADFNSWAFSDFQAQLEKLYRSVAGSASFASYEAQLELMLTCDVQGHVQLRGEAMDFAGTGNKPLVPTRTGEAPVLAAQRRSGGVRFFRIQRR